MQELNDIGNERIRPQTARLVADIGRARAPRTVPRWAWMAAGAVLLAFMLLAPSGCGTVRGIGQDMMSASEGIAKAMQSDDEREGAR